MSMSAPPKVTIGIPTYNRPDGLRRTVQCMLDQTYPWIEIIISDNCSTDDSVEKIGRDFAARDKRVRYIHQPENLGAVRNLFHLLEEAGNDYFMWAADDDWWDPRFIEVTLPLLIDRPQAAVSLARFTPMAESNVNPVTRLPDYHEHIKKLSNPDSVLRMRNYIRQKDVYGKAHIIYGLMRTRALREAVRITRQAIEPRACIGDFMHMDVVLNGALLSIGDITTTDQPLRRFSYGARKSPPKTGTKWIERMLKYDRRIFIYLDCYYPIIDKMPLGDSEKARLRRAVRLRKFNFIMERIGRRLLVYKIYWHFKKRLCFKPVIS